MSDSLEITLLKKQNTQLAARIDNYRKYNKELVHKNQGLSVWSANMASILSSIEASFRVFLTNQESLYELIKPKGNKEAAATVAKCVGHFKHFNQILSNLSNKIYQNQRSNQFTKEAKQGIESLVSAYQMFFKDFLKSYFAHNQKYEQWLTSALKSSDFRDQYRDMFKKQKENQVLIKEFNLYFQQLRGKLPAYQKQNQGILLGDLLKKRNEEVDQLCEKNARLSHRFRLLMDYNPNVVTNALSETQNYACICGGIQIQYLKQKWELHEKLKQEEKMMDLVVEKGMDSEERKVLENQIEELVRQNAEYLNKNEQLRIENSIEETIFKSHAYDTLIKETQELIKYCGTLQSSNKELETVIIEMEGARQRELEILREKYESEKRSVGVEPPVMKARAQDNNIGEVIGNAFAPFMAKIEENNIWEQTQLKIERNIREANEKVRLDSESAYKKYEDYLRKEDKIGEIQFKHESHKMLIKQVQGYLPKDGLLQKFNQYIRGRQKKVQNCQRQIRKLQKQLNSKSTICDNLKNNFQINQGQFQAMNIKNMKLQEALKSIQDQMKKVFYENIELKNNNQKQRSLLELKLKSECEINLNNQQKVKVLEEKIEKYEEYPGLYDEYVRNQEVVLGEMKEKLETTEEECEKTNELLNNKLSKLREYEKSEKRYTEVNERLRSKLNAINKTEAQNQENTDEQKLNYALIQLQEFKNKYYCSCQKQRKIQVSLKTCPHVFCRNCVQDVTKTRSRACPICRIKFSRGDINYMKWT